MISLIVPVLNEENTIKTLLDDITALSGNKEVIIADGGSADRTKELAQSRAVVVDCPRGRGPQCNMGALHAGGDIFFFLHADSSLANDALYKIEQAVKQGAKWGCLKLAFDDTHWLTRFIAWLSNMRVCWRGVAYGDQGIFITRDLFEELGGFPALPLMEDYQFSLNLKEKKIRPVQVNSRIISSARRLVSGGRLRVFWRMYRLRKLYRNGTNISVVQTVYGDIR